jgi:hypothetical protein
MKQQPSEPDSSKPDTIDTSQLLSYTDAAEKVLMQEGKPLSHRQLAAKAIKEGLIPSESSSGDTLPNSCQDLIQPRA